MQKIVRVEFYYYIYIIINYIFSLFAGRGVLIVTKSHVTESQPEEIERLKIDN
jgi:hypothetical protein